MDADTRLRQTWENVWRTDDVEAEHRDAIASDASPNTMIFRPYVDRMLGALRSADAPSKRGAASDSGSTTRWKRVMAGLSGSTLRRKR